MTDPTGTAGLRRAFLAEGNRRLGQVRSLTHTILVEHDLMHARNDPLAQFLPHPGHRLAAFAEWFSRTVDQQLLRGNWWERYLQRAYDSGLVAGGELVRASSVSSRPLPAVFSELASRELAGIAAALVQQVTRQAGLAGITKQKPQLMYRAVLTAIKKVGMTRLKAFVNFTVVQIHNAARLEQFKAAGVTQVGIIPERLVIAKPSRFLKHDHVMRDRDEVAAAKKKRLAAEQDLAELLAQQAEEAAAEAAAAQVEAEKARAAVAKEIEQHLAGENLPTLSMAQAKAELWAAQAQANAEIAAAKAATAARNIELKKATETLLAAQKEERAAAYAARTTVPVETVARRAASPISELVTQLVRGGLATLPERLTKIGAEFVNVQTAGDDRVCDECDGIAADGPYSLAEAQGLIPAHPNCRCAFVPAFDKRFAVNRELAGAAAE